MKPGVAAPAAAATAAAGPVSSWGFDNATAVPGATRAAVGRTGSSQNLVSQLPLTRPVYPFTFDDGFE